MKSMKNTREIAAEYRLSHWAEILQRRKESGMNIRKFCEAEGMHQNKYHYWQRKLREAAVAQLLPVESGSRSSLAPAGWKQVSAIEEKSKTESSAGVTIEIGKCRIVASETSDMELLAKVCKTLVEL